MPGFPVERSPEGLGRGYWVSTSQYREAGVPAYQQVGMTCDGEQENRIVTVSAFVRR
jgi:hypothetical protein